MNKTEDDDIAFYMNKKEQFANRGSLTLPRTVHVSALENLSLYAFYRQFYVQGNRLHFRQKEKFLTLTGLGFPAQAARDHADHEFFAKRTLYAYMPCAGLRGLDYIDNIVERFFQCKYGALLQEFVETRENIWCPTWVQRNYRVRNAAKEKTDLPNAPPVSATRRRWLFRGRCGTPPTHRLGLRQGLNQF